MRVYYERTISRESNKSNLYLRMHNHILSVKMTYWIMKKRTRKERVCLLSLSYACFAAILNLFQKLDHFDSFLKKYIKKYIIYIQHYLYSTYSNRKALILMMMHNNVLYTLKKLNEFFFNWMILMRKD